MYCARSMASRPSIRSILPNQSTRTDNKKAACCSPKNGDAAFLRGSTIVFNVFSTGIIDHTFLGQVDFDLSEHPELQLSTSEKSILVSLDLKSASYPVYTTDGEKLVPVGTQIRGKIVVSITTTSILSDLSGWFAQMKPSLLGSPMGQKIWVILCSRTLYIYDTPYATNLLAAIDRRTIESVDSIAFNRGYDHDRMIPTGLEIKYKDKGNEGCMLWGWVEQSDLVRGLWERALDPEHIHSMSVGSSPRSPPPSNPTTPTRVRIVSKKEQESPHDSDSSGWGW